MSSRRAYGSGSLYVRTDRRGRESYYGRWYADGTRVERKLGPKRPPGSTEGLTVTAAEAEMRRQMALVKPTPAVADRLTVKQASEQYLKALENLGRKRSTVVGVNSILRVWLLPHLGDKGLDAVTPRDVEDLAATMRRSGVAPKTIHNAVATLRALYRWAGHPRRRWATTNPVDAVELPALTADAPLRFLTLDQIASLLEHLGRGEYAALDRALYVTAAQTGLRQGELIALRWSDVDMAARRVRVTRSHVLGEFDTPKSARSLRSVPLSSGVLDALTDWSKVTHWPEPSHLVFGEPATGEPLKRGALMRRWRRALEDADLPAHRFHDLRHTFGTQAAGAGIPLRTLQEWLGHRDIATTMRYSAYSPNAEEVAMVDRAFADA